MWRGHLLLFWRHVRTTTWHRDTLAYIGFQISSSSTLRPLIALLDHQLNLP